MTWDRTYKSLPIERAVEISTRAGARRLRLQDRGFISTGLRADLVVFDPANLADVATYVDPQQYGMGFQTVVVNGGLAIDDAAHTGARPGEVARAAEGSTRT